MATSPLSLRMVSTDCITVNPAQPRRTFTAPELTELADSIKRVGFIHPPTVRQLVDSNRFELIAGERRWRAAQQAGIEHIPVFIVSTSAEQSAELALIENLQRANLNAIEIALAIRALGEEQQLSQTEIADRLGKSRSTVANYLRLLNLPPAIQKSLQANEMTMGHAKAILSLPTVEQQLHLAALICRDNLSVRWAEYHSQRIVELKQHAHLSARAAVKSKVPLATTLDSQLKWAKEELQRQLGTRVDIEQTAPYCGRICLGYCDLAALEQLLEKIGCPLSCE